MKNPHVIVDDSGRCLCGMYGKDAIGCTDIISALDHLNDSPQVPRGLFTSIQTLTEVLRPLIQDRGDAAAPITTERVTLQITKIILNGAENQMIGRRVSYAEIQSAALEKSIMHPPVLTVTYFRGPAANKEGSLIPGQSIDIIDGMVFSAVSTNDA